MASLDGISQSIGNFDPSNIFGVGNPIMTKIAFFFKIFFWFAVGVFAVIAIWKLFLQFKIKITIKKRIGNGAIETTYDKAKIVVDKQNKRKLQLMKTRNGKRAITCPIPAAIYKGKSGKADHYELWLDDNYQLHPIEMPVVEEGRKHLLKIKPQERDAWMRLESKQVMEKYAKKDMMEKYLPAGILMIAMITAFLIWFFAAKQLGAGLGDLAQQFAQIASSCTHLGVAG